MSRRSRVSARPLAVNVRVCSARGLSVPKKTSVALSLGDYRIQTPAKKSNSNGTVFWNSSHGFVTSSASSDEPLSLELRVRKSRVGRVDVRVPRDEVGVLKDVWVDVDVGESSPVQVHLCVQAEELGNRSMVDILDENSRVSSSRRSARSSLVRRASSSGAAVEQLLATTIMGNTFFSTHKSSQVTLREIVNSLDAVKAKLSSFEAHTERIASVETNKRCSVDLHKSKSSVAILSSLKNELLAIQERIDKVSGLSEDWRSQLCELALSYLGDVYELLSLSQAAWSHTTTDKAMRRKSSSSSYSSWKVGKAPVSLSSTSDSEVSYGVVSDDASDEDDPLDFIEEDNDDVEFGAVVKDFVLTDTDAFDSLTANGYAVEIIKPGIPRTNPEDENDSLIIECTGFVLNIRAGRMVSFTSRKDVRVEFKKDSKNHEVVFTKGEVPLPKGIYECLQSLTSRCEFRISLSPSMAFGAGGYQDVVPGDSTLVYEGRVVGDVVSASGEIKSAANVRRNDTRAHADALRRKLDDDMLLAAPSAESGKAVVPVRPDSNPPPRVVSGGGGGGGVGTPGYSSTTTSSSRRKRRTARKTTDLTEFLKKFDLSSYEKVLKSNGWKDTRSLKKISRNDVQALFPKDVADKRKLIDALKTLNVSWSVVPVAVAARVSSRISDGSAENDAAAELL